MSDPHVGQPQFVEDLSTARADLQVDLIGEVEPAVGLDHVGEQVDHVAVLAEQLKLDVGLVILEFLGDHGSSSCRCGQMSSSYRSAAPPAEARFAPGRTSLTDCT